LSWISPAQVPLRGGDVLGNLRLDEGLQDQRERFADDVQAAASAGRYQQVVIADPAKAIMVISLV
jgi:hypothetical protein